MIYSPLETEQQDARHCLANIFGLRKNGNGFGNVKLVSSAVSET